ncbi:4-phytase [Methylobacterium sp. 4-46]|uniref:ABC transporter substrate-binding protein n=1 Tax=unclassified Methylobacterium TaxID=2615210 RepID=UPI000152D327|nr:MULTISPECIES: ABC transporter substrate-binding protein [Methylobacterium]ACA19468.1 4-phytase [Methylobacterium sp. 4-46]WFT78666.1 ABC transporter substrate-binding protein [Methylobacterium nodulans]
MSPACPALVGLVLAALAAAAGVAGRARAAEVPDDVLVVGQSAEPASLDPGVTTATNDARILVNLYDGLVRTKPGSLEIEPALAESWSLSEDGRRYTFRLRAGVRFHDGSPLDARAVTFTFGRLLEPAHPAAATGPFPLAFLFRAVERVEALDPRTVRFTLRQPFAPFLANLATPTGLIVPPGAVMARGKDFGRNPVGTGPFRFEAWQSSRKVTLARNPGYWGGPAASRLVIFRPLADPNTRATEMLAGDVDVVAEMPPDALALFRHRAGFSVAEAVGPHLWYLILNMRAGPLRDRRVREAVNWAIDRRALAEHVLQGTAVPARGIIAPAFAGTYDPDLAGYGHDPARARALLREAGAEGARLTLLVAEGGSGMLDPVAMGTAIQADLARVGLDVRLVTYEWNAYLARVNRGLGEDADMADMAEMAWMTNDPDQLPSLALASDALPGKGGFNAGGYANPDLDRLLDEARRSTDPARRRDLDRAAERLVVADAPFAVVVHGKQAAVVREAVRGFALDPTFTARLAGVRKREGP